MTVLYYLVLILHLIACFFLIAVVLLQQGKGQDLASAFGGGGTQAAFGPRGSATLLSRVTTGLAAVFMITSISLAVLKQKQASVLDAIPAVATPTPAAGPTNLLGVPVTPAGSPQAATPAGATTSPSPAASPAASVVVPADGKPAAVAPVAIAPAKPAASASPKP
jgi:preprotein translocase subunit SecG